MTTETRRSFTDEFEKEAVTLLESSGRPVAHVASELGVQPSMLRNGRLRSHSAIGYLTPKKTDLRAA